MAGGGLVGSRQKKGSVLTQTLPGAHEPGCQVEVSGRGRQASRTSKRGECPSQGYHTESVRGQGPRGTPEATVLVVQEQSPRQSQSEGVSGAEGPRVPQMWSRGVWQASSVFERLSLEIPGAEGLSLLPTGRTFVSGQPSKGRKSRVLGAAGAGLVMATARPPAGAPRAPLGP